MKGFKSCPSGGDAFPLGNVCMLFQDFTPTSSEERNQFKPFIVIPGFLALLQEQEVAGWGPNSKSHSVDPALPTLQLFKQLYYLLLCTATAFCVLASAMPH